MRLPNAMRHAAFLATCLVAVTAFAETNSLPNPDFTQGNDAPAGWTLSGGQGRWIDGNLLEVTPFVNFPVTSRSALPIFLALVTYAIFVVVGFSRQGLHYLKKTLFPPGIPKFLYVLVTPIEFVSTFLVRPFSLAVRLFANLVAGHVMLSLLLVSGFIFIKEIGDIGARSVIGLGWFAIGLAIFLFEIVVAVLQAYIFTLLAAVYIQTSVHPEH